jgi:hydroxymethylbilane synthase
MLLSTKTLKVGARSSPLSRVQVQEVLDEIRRHYPFIQFEICFTETQGDKDQTKSLRTLEKTDFFTKEVDQLVLKKECAIGIHSAKDLPDPLTRGLSIVAITKGLDSSDVLVLRPHDRIDSLPPNAVIYTSSERREAAVRQLRSDLTFRDLRGTIHQRLAKIDRGEADGVVVAEAALILTHLNRIKLPGSTTPLQGQLAILAREEDLEMHKLFSLIDSR